MRSCFPSSSSSSRKKQSDLSYSTRQNNKAREAGSIGQAGREQATALCVCGLLELLQPPRALSDAQHRDKGKISFQSILSQHVWSTQDSFFKQSLLYLIHYKIWKNCRKAADWNWRSLARNSSGPSAKWSTISIKTRKGHSWEADKKVPLLYKPQFKCPVYVRPSDAMCSSGPRIPSWSLPDETWHLHLQRNTSRGVLFCLFKRKKKKRKKDKGKEKQQMTVGNWQHEETLSSLSWLIYWTETSEAQGTRGHRSTHRSSLPLSLCISYLLTYIYIFIFIYFFTSSGYHDSNCSHMNTGVISRA